MKPPAIDPVVTDAELDAMTREEAYSIGESVYYRWKQRQSILTALAKDADEHKRLREWREKRSKA